MLLQGCLPIKVILPYRLFLTGFIISSLSLKFTVFSHCWRPTNSFGPNSFFDHIFYVHHLLNYIFLGSHNYFWTLNCLNIKLVWTRLFIHCNLFLNTFRLMKFNYIDPYFIPRHRNYFLSLTQIVSKQLFNNSSVMIIWICMLSEVRSWSI